VEAYVSCDSTPPPTQAKAVVQVAQARLGTALRLVVLEDSPVFFSRPVPTVFPFLAPQLQVLSSKPRRPSVRCYLPPGLPVECETQY